MANVKHLAHYYSDHCPQLIQLQEEDKRLGNRPFRFQAAWMLHHDFFKWMEREWNWEGNLTKSLKEFVMKLEAWNKDTFGNIFKRKKRNSLRLVGGSH